MSPAFEIRAAIPADHPALIALQWRASLVWDDVRDQLLARPELIDGAIPPEMIEAGRVLVACRGPAIVGFATIVPHDRDAELEGLFVEPTEWRQGIGLALVAAVAGQARAAGAGVLHVIANRNVERFYLAAGFTRTGKMETLLGPIALLMEKPLG